MSAEKAQETDVYVARENPPPYTTNQPTPGPSVSIFPTTQMGSVTYVHTTQPVGYTQTGIPVSGSPMVIPVAVTQFMGPKPVTSPCRSCQTTMVTRTESNVAVRAHLCALLLCLVGLWPCMCLPYCMDTCRNVDHYCSNCNAYIGSSI